MGKRQKKRDRAAAGARRKTHFQAGGDPASWRGRAVTFTDKKKEAEKRACRSRANVEDDS